MSTQHFVFGATAVCADGAAGKLTGLVVARLEHAEARAEGYGLSYIVVEPAHRIAMGRLIPLTLAQVGDNVVHLSCDLATFNTLPMAEASRLLPGVERTYGIVGSWYSGVGMAANDIVPPGHVVLHGGAPVQSAGPGAALWGAAVDREDEDRLVGFLVSVKRRWGRRQIVTVALDRAGPVSTGTRQASS